MHIVPSSVTRVAALPDWPSSSSETTTKNVKGLGLLLPKVAGLTASEKKPMSESMQLNHEEVVVGWWIWVLMRSIFFCELTYSIFKRLPRSFRPSFGDSDNKIIIIIILDILQWQNDMRNLCRHRDMISKTSHHEDFLFGLYTWNFSEVLSWSGNLNDRAKLEMQSLVT